ncbi:rab guanine nucleotide exchange factor S2 [Physocladia obscura]|uniref:Rab guanine nucleotide exchange factor S2 n=1 Tax=Physocladia obscura TaxID=109957 RepID=A0AAD5X9B5_9FUNG|nr:rab guanine nucleotide exchange factor S2 [Physocladia obscura]
MSERASDSVTSAKLSPKFISSNNDDDNEYRVSVLLRKFTDLESIHKITIEKAAREKEQAAEDLAKKNLLIDCMRIKLNRYEFALKEAILFLAKPMEAYEVWLNSKHSESNNVIVVKAIQGAIAIANPAYTTSGQSFLTANTQQTVSSNPSSPSSHTPTTPINHPASRSRTTSNLPKNVNSASSASLTIITNTDANLSNHSINNTSENCPNLEIHCLECMRLSLNYLKNAQASIGAIDKVKNFSDIAFSTTDSLIQDPAKLLLNIKPLDDALRELKSSLETPSQIAQYTTPSPTNTKVQHEQQQHAQKQCQNNSNTGSSAVAKSRALAYARLHSPERRRSTNITNTALLRAATLVMPIAGSRGSSSSNASTSSSNNSSVLINAFEDDDGDIASKHPLSLPASSQSQPQKIQVSKVQLATTASSPISLVAQTNPALSIPESTTVSPVAARCPSCRELMIQIDLCNDTMQTLREDVRTLANQLEDERAMRDRNQLAKDILDQELEELTSQLFEQANKMVVDEARMRDELETSNRELKGQLKELVGRCEGREEELKELARNLKALEAAKMRSSVMSMNSGGGGGGGGSLHNSIAGGLNSQSTINLFPRIGMSSLSSHAYYSGMGISVKSSFSQPSIQVDGILFGEFKDHIRQALSAIASTTNPNPTPATTANETLFMKRCILEDVEPCLFGAYPALNPGPAGIYSTSKLAKPGTGAGVSQTNGLVAIRKRLIDALIKGQLDVFSVVESESFAALLLASSPTSVGSATPNSSAKSPLPPPKSKCAACMLVRECEYKMRVLDKSPADVLPLCVFCRDRVATVCDFFVYMGHLRQGIIGPGKQGVTMLGMLRHALWLKRRMAIARVGNCVLFEADVMGAVDRKSGDGEWEKLVNVVH